MPADAFWGIIEQVAPLAADAQQDALREILRGRPLEEVIAFEVTFRRQLDAACTWDLWGAAYVAMGGCSDDGFEHFRCWLVSKGRRVYEVALADPDTLARADLQPGPDGVWEHEGISQAVREVFEEKGGEGVISDHWEAPPEEPAGEPFEEDPAHLARRYPLLWHRFGETPLG